MTDGVTESQALEASMKATINLYQKAQISWIKVFVSILKNIYIKSHIN